MDAQRIYKVHFFFAPVDILYKKKVLTYLYKNY